MKDNMSKIEIIVNDYENQLVALIEYIKSTSGIGHSFDVVVDPDMREYRKSFYIDGDGSFSIKDVLLNGKSVKIDKKGKLIESYLQKIQ